MGNFGTSEFNAAVGRISQANYKDKTAAAANAFVQEKLKSPARVKIEPLEKDDADYAKGHNYAEDSWVESWKTSVQWQMDLASQNLGRYLLAVMGNVSTSQPDAANDPTVYEHIFTPLDRLTSHQLRAYSILEHLAPSQNGVDRLAPSMVAKSLQVASSGKAKLDGNLQWEGSGEIVEPSAVTWATHVNSIQGALNYFFAKQSELIRSDTDGSNAVNVKCDLKSWSFGVQNEFAEDDYGCNRYLDDDPEKGAIRDHYLLTKQMFTQEWVNKLQANSPEHQHLLDRKPLKIINKMIGGNISNAFNHQLEITSFLSKYSAIDDGFEDGFATVGVKPKMLFDTSANKIVEVKLTNNVASYTV